MDLFNLTEQKQTNNLIELKPANQQLNTSRLSFENLGEHINNESNKYLEKWGADKFNQVLLDLKKIDFGKAVRAANYTAIHAILQSQDIINNFSTKSSPLLSNTDISSAMYIFDRDTPNYRSDEFAWDLKKWHVKLIIYNEETKQYRVKNKSTEVGIPVMRRQIWRGISRPSGIKWRRYEYKLFQTEFYTKVNKETGTIEEKESQELQDFPVIVHYHLENTKATNNHTPKSRPAKRQKVEQSLNTESLIPLENQDLNNNVNIEPITLENYFSNEDNSLDFLSYSDDSDTFANSSFDSEPFQSFVNPILSLNPSNEILENIMRYSENSSPLQIQTYAPDSGPCHEYTKVLLVLQGASPDNQNYKCIFEGQEILTTQVVPGVLEFLAAPHAAGVVNFWVICKNGVNTLFSSQVPFYYLPFDERGQLDLSNLSRETELTQTILKFKHVVKDLNLSSNNLKDLNCLINLSALKSLNLDNNAINVNCTFPKLEQLQTLSLRNNKIDDFQLFQQFVEHMNQFLPNLKYLYLNGNEAVPSAIEKPHIHYNYRIFVISKLNNLLQLDGEMVTFEERQHSSYIVEEEL